MKKFIEVLKENGIRIPEQKEWIPDWLFKRIKTAFRKKWNDAAWEYSELSKQLKRKANEYQMYDNMLKENGYDVKMPELPDATIPRFKTPRKAVEAISEVRELLQKHNSREVYQITQKEGKEKWAHKILTEMEDGCKMIVVKDEEFSPLAETIKKFDEATAAGEESCIRNCFCFLEWAAFKADNKCAFDILMMIPSHPKSISVKYI